MKTFACSADWWKVVEKHDTAALLLLRLLLQWKRSLVDVGVPARLKDSSRRFKTSAGGPAVANAAKIWRLPPSRQQPIMFENKRLGHGKTVWTYTLTNPVFSLTMFIVWSYFFKNWIKRIYLWINSSIPQFEDEKTLFFFISTTITSKSLTTIKIPKCWARAVQSIKSCLWICGGVRLAGSARHGQFRQIRLKRGENFQAYYM